MTPSQIEQACLVVAHPKFEWRDGMKPVSPSNPEAPYASCIRLGRSLADEDEWEEDPESRFYPHMGSWHAGERCQPGWPARTSGWLPDLQDPATLGCMLALVREVWGDPCLYVMCSPGEEPGDPTEWQVRIPLRHGSRILASGSTEGEALVNVLLALPTPKRKKKP